MTGHRERCHREFVNGQVTTPYEFTGQAKVMLAEDGAERVREIVDGLLFALIGAGIAEVIEFVGHKRSATA